jgi:hypothetical protein
MLYDYKEKLENIMIQTYEVVRVGHLLYHVYHEMEKLKPRQDAHLAVLLKWKHDLLPMWHETRTPGERYIMAALLMHWHMCFVMLSACTSPLQSAFDNHYGDFAAIVENARSCLQLKAVIENGGRTYTLRTDVIEPLLFTATRCRDPMLRRRALHLLREAPLGTGLWSLVAAPFVVEKMIALEEGDEHYSEDPTSTQAPSEEDRIHHVGFVNESVADGCRQIKFEITKAVRDQPGSLRLVREEVWVEHRLI